MSIVDPSVLELLEHADSRLRDETVGNRIARTSRVVRQS